MIASKKETSTIAIFKGSVKKANAQFEQVKSILASLSNRFLYDS